MTRALSVLIVLGAACPVLAADPDGAAVFAEACAACHGPEARGGGPVPDLTLFAARNDGVFDRGRVIRLVDGREGLSAHGGPMPMFGGLLTGAAVTALGADGTPVDTSAPILALVEWLETQQREAEQ